MLCSNEIWRVPLHPTEELKRSRCRECLSPETPDPVQVCKAGVARLRKIWLTRHGESEYNEKALIGGNSNLTPSGQVYARLLPDVIVDRVPLVRCSYSLTTHCGLLDEVLLSLARCQPHHTRAQK